MGNHFSFEQIPDLSNKVFVITGANTGIGYITAQEIARHNGDVILCCRSEEKTKAAIAKIELEFQSAKLEKVGKLKYVHLDLMSLKSAENCARSICKEYTKIDCLINNAGIMAPPFQITKDRIESQFGTNHMGHFVLTMLLLPLLRAADRARIINLSSLAHTSTYPGGLLPIDELMVPPESTEEEEEKGESPTTTKKKSKAEQKYKRWTSYGMSKLANILFTKYLALHIPPTMKSYAVHPGVVNTDLGRNMLDIAIVGKIAQPVGSLFGKTPSQGSITTLRAATDPRLDSVDDGCPSGTYFVPQGKPQVPSAMACDGALIEKIWELSVEISQQVLGDAVTSEMKGNLEALKVK